MIEVTDIAITKLISRNVKNVRLGITGGGCAGYEYIFAEDNIKDGDEVLDYGKFNLLIDRMSQPYLSGMTLDYVKEGINEFFKFLNPNEQSSCGCGVSVQFNENIISKG
jgi:iron-sulfur cluster assembly accessory protein